MKGISVCWCVIIFSFSCSNREYVLMHAITGQIYDQDMKPLQDATVDFTREKRHTDPFNIGAVTSDSMGYFFKPGTTRSDYKSYVMAMKHISFTLLIEKNGYLSDTVDVSSYAYAIDSMRYAHGKDRVYDTIDVGAVILKRK